MLRRSNSLREAAANRAVKLTGRHYVPSRNAASPSGPQLTFIVRLGCGENQLAFHVSRRWGGDIDEPTVAEMREVLSELDAEDEEHPSVALIHESGWCLAAYGTLLVWEHLEGTGDPRHMNNASRDRVLELWLKLSRGEIAEVESEHWLPGYYDRN